MKAKNSDGVHFLLDGLAGAAVATVVSAAQPATANAAPSPYADAENRSLPDPGMRLDLRRTALASGIFWRSDSRWPWCAMRQRQQSFPRGDGYLAALINFRFIANGVWTTDETIKRLTHG